jgi:uncharacterized protein (DUF488 family)
LKLYTIGFTKKDARTFFCLLIDNHARTIIDVRIHNQSQLAGFTKKDDLPYFLEKIAGIRYVHLLEAAPEESLMKNLHGRKITWQAFETAYRDLLVKRKVFEKVDQKILDDGCLLCSEPTPEHCHRRLFAEYLKEKNPDLEIVHL